MMSRYGMLSILLISRRLFSYDSRLDFDNESRLLQNHSLTGVSTVMHSETCGRCCNLLCFHNTEHGISVGYLRYSHEHFPRFVSFDLSRK